MPMYEYHCKTCDQTIEVLLRQGEPEPARCGEDCALEYGREMGAGEVQRVLSVTGGYVMGASRPGAPRSEPYCGACGQNREPCGDA